MSLQTKINAAVKEVAKISHLFPCVAIIHDIRTTAPVWMCERGLKELHLSLEELKSLNAKDYYARFFNEEDSKEINPKIISLLERNNDGESVSFFQQVRINKKADWTWHFTSTKILLRDDNQIPVLLFSLSMPIGGMHNMAQKALRLQEENNFLRKNFHQFSSLTQREIEVLRHLAMGKSAQESGDDLFISPQTIDTHKKNIKKKLKTSSFFELCKYARSFDLI